MKNATISLLIMILLATSLQAYVGFKVVFPIGKVAPKKNYQTSDTRHPDHSESIRRPSLGSALIPGLYQLQKQQRLKGWGLLLVTGASIPLGLGYRHSSNDLFEQYEDLGPGLSPDDYDYYFNRASDRETWSNRFYLLAGVTYLYNWVDAIYDWSKSRPPPMQLVQQTQPHNTYRQETMVYSDTVYLKNGGLIRGEIIHFIPGEICRIKTQDGSIFVYSGEEIKAVTFGAKNQGAVPRMAYDRKSPGLAVLFAWLLPSAGHGYAGDWGRGVKFILLDIGSFAVIGAGLSKTQIDCGGFFRCEETLTDDGASLVGIGFLSLLAFRVWEFVDAYDAANDYNRIGRSGRYSLRMENIGTAPSLKMAYTF